MKCFKLIIFTIICILVFCSCSIVDTNSNALFNSTSQEVENSESNLNEDGVLNDTDKIPNDKVAVLSVEELRRDAKLITEYIICSGDYNLLENIKSKSFDDNDVYRFIYMLSESDIKCYAINRYIMDGTLHISLEEAQEIALNIFGKNNWFINENFNEESQKYELPLDVGFNIKYGINIIDEIIDSSNNQIQVKFEILEKKSSLEGDAGTQISIEEHIFIYDITNGLTLYNML